MRLKTLYMLIPVLAAFVMAAAMESAAGARKEILVAPVSPEGGQAPGVLLDVEELRKRSRSRMELPAHGGPVEILLFAEDERTEVVEQDSCGRKKGDSVYTGNYHLLSLRGDSVISTLDLGRGYRFTEGRPPHDGLRGFAVPGTEGELAAIYQYLGCRTLALELFRVDGDGRIHRVRFLNRDGSEETRALTGPEGKVYLSDREAAFCSYSSAIGHTFCYAYTYNGRDFVQSGGWMARGEAMERTPEAEARLVLFNYLTALERGDYGRAVYYYGGSYGLLEGLNPDVDPDERARLFERYCKVNGGRCLIPDLVADVDVTDPSRMEFAVGFVSRGYEPLVVEGRRRFAFKVGRIGGEFKVLDLPPLVR